MTPRPEEEGSEVPQMDPAVLIFLLYLMILHELVSGWMAYQKQATKPKKQTVPPWLGSISLTSDQEICIAKSQFSIPAPIAAIVVTFAVRFILLCRTTVAKLK